MATGTFIPFANLSGNGSTAAISLESQVQGTFKGDTESTAQVVSTVWGTTRVDLEARLASTLAWAVVEADIAANKIVRIGVAQAVRLTVKTYDGTGTIGGGVLI